MSLFLDEYLEKVRSEKDELYKTDLVYRLLVDNYVKSGFTGSSDSLNALATYTTKLQDNARLEFFKQLDFTYEDLANMFKERVISKKTILDMIEWKYKIKKN